MRFLRTTGRGILLAAVLAAPLFASPPSPSAAAQAGLTYGEVTRFVPSDQPAPQPGTFATDFQAAVDAQKALSASTQHHGLFSVIMNAANMAKNAMNAFTKGSASTEYYMNGWERTDNPATQTATINRPDKREIIHLDLAKKTYSITDMSATTTQTPPPYQPPSGPQQPAASPQPGTGKLDISESSTIIGPKTIEGVATTGYDQEFKMVSSQSTGSCHDGSFSMSMQNYVSSYGQPTIGHGSVSMASVMVGQSPAGAGAHPGCSPKITNHHSGGVTAPFDKLAMWTLITLKGGAQTQQGAMGGQFSTLIERGMVRTLGPSDAGLFDIPAGFTKEQ
jgi:hypothetical protein